MTTKVHEQKHISSLFAGYDFEIDDQQTEDYEYWVNKTAKLIKKPYFVTHKMVESWPLAKIKERYNDALKVEGMPQDVWWYWKRKQDKSKQQHN